MTDPSVMSFHLLSLKTFFPGFRGYDVLSLLWGAVLVFVYGYLASMAFHSLHNDCCIQKNNQKDEKNKCVWDDKHIILIIAMLVIGILVGFILNQAENPYARKSFRDSTMMMRQNGSSMMQMGKMMMDEGSMMERRGSSMMERGDEVQKMMGDSGE